MADKHSSTEIQEILQTKNKRNSLVSLQGILCNKVTTLSAKTIPHRNVFKDRINYSSEEVCTALSI